MRRAVRDSVRAEVEGLAVLSFSALKARYQKLVGEASPKRIGRRLLILAAFYELQHAAHRGARNAEKVLAKRLAKGGAAGLLTSINRTLPALLTWWRKRPTETTRAFRLKPAQNGAAETLS